MDYYVGIDIGGSSIKHGLVDKNGLILKKNQMKTPIVGDEVIQAILSIVKNYQLEEKISGVGISIPGIVEEDGFLTTAGAIYDLYGVHLKNILEKQLALPVAIENDAISSALAEKWIGAGKDYSSFFTTVIGTGVGGAIIINDKVLRGAHSTAGEFGFMIVNEIVENDTRGATLSLNGSVQFGLVDNYHEQQEKSYKLSELNGEKIYALAEENDRVALKVLDRFYDKLAKSFFNVLTFLDPEVILVGGAISSNTQFITELNKRVTDLKNTHDDMLNMNLAKIKPCHFLNDAGIIGATYKVIQDTNELNVR